jgi:hypothetical protein
MNNRSALFSILAPSSTHRDPMEGITCEGLNSALAAVDSAMRNVNRSKMKCDDRELIRSEFDNAAAMLRFACQKGRWKLDPSTQGSESLTDAIQQITAEHRRCWLQRNRPDGLDDSIRRLDG